jgi:hypothetical protein
VIREVSDGDFDRLRAVREWPLRELLLAYIERMRAAALRSYETELLVWSVLAPHQKRSSKPPAVPRILR